MVIGFLNRKKDADCCTITDDALSEKRGKKQVFEEEIKYEKGKREEKKRRLGSQTSRLRREALSIAPSRHSVLTCSRPEYARPSLTDA